MKVLTFLVAILLMFYQASSSPADRLTLGRQMRSASNGEGQIMSSSEFPTDIEAVWQNYDNCNDDISCDGVDCSVSQRMASPNIGKFIKKFSKIGDCMKNISDNINGGGAADANSTLAP